MIATFEDKHVYMCNHSGTESVTWRVNGSVLNVEIFPLEIVSNLIPLPGGRRVSTLTVGGHPEHNETTIQCSAQLESGPTMMTPSVTFLIQGI